MSTPGRRAAEYWFIDGFPEIVAGIGFAALGGSALWFGRIPHSWSSRVTFLGVTIVSLGVVFFWDRAISLFLKSHVTFPRTGYVRPPADWGEVSRQETVLSLGLGRDQRAPDQNVTRFRDSTIGVLICGNLLAGLFAWPVGLPIALTVVAALLYALHRDSERPYHWASVLPLPLAGIGAMFLHLSQDANGWAAVCIGGAWLASQGGWRLMGYLLRHPKDAHLETSLP